ncbi:hypothetical protein D3C75_1124480 [compost metagenome]
MLACDPALDAVADDGGHPAGCQQHGIVCSFAAKRAGYGVFGVGFQRAGDGQALVFAKLRQGLDAHQADIAGGQGTCLVHHDPVGPGQHIQHVAAAQQDAAAGQVGCGRGERRRGRQ